jgi:hypothetical protein
MANQLGDKLFKSYQDISKSGAAAADGMSGLWGTAKKLGLTMDELGGLVTAVGANSKDLALFAGSVSEGRKQLGNMGAALEGSRGEFLRLGMYMTDVTEGQLGYLQLQTRLGNSQKMTTAQLAAGAKAYLIEQDALTKLTGLTRKEAEEMRESALSEQRFRAKIEEVRSTQGEAAAQRLIDVNQMLSSQSKEMGQGFRDISTGMLGTEAAQKANMGTNGEIMVSTQKLIAGTIDQFQAVTQIGKAAGQFAKDLNMSAQLGTFGDFATDYAGQIKLGIFAMGDVQAKYALIKQDQEKMLKGGSDKMLEFMTKLTESQINAFQAEQDRALSRLGSSADMNSLLLKMGKMAGDALEKLAEIALKLVDVFKQLYNMLPGFMRGEDTVAPKTEQQVQAAAVTNKARDASKPLQQSADVLAAQLAVDEKTLDTAKRAGALSEEHKKLAEKVAKDQAEYEKVALALIEQEKEIVAAAREERKLRQQRALDQGELSRLELMNRVEVQRLGNLNKEKADMLLAGKDPTTTLRGIPGLRNTVDEDINKVKTENEKRDERIATLKNNLAPKPQTLSLIHI